MSRQALEIDLANRIGTPLPLRTELVRRRVGGRALALELLADLPADDDAIIIAPGALCNSGAPAANRCSIVFTSPLTGTIFSVQEGGPFPITLQQSGFAALIIRGVSAAPVLLHIDSRGSRFSDGCPWWGKEADLTAAALGTEGKGVLTIGPAGEEGVLFAGLHGGDGNLFGRGGPGACFGAKRLKAIVVSGEEKTVIANPSAFAVATNDLERLLRASPLLCGPVGFGPFGEAALVDLAARRQLLPTRNFLSPFAGDAAAFNAAALKRSGESHGFGCSGCLIACKRRDGSGLPLPDFSTLAAFGALLALPDLAAIHRLNTLCNRLGLDPVSLAGVLAARSEIEERPLPPEELEELLPAIAYRRGEGALLALGAARYAAAKGQPEVAMTVRSLELAPLDLRSGYGLALAGAVAVNGQGDQALTISAEVLRKPVPVDRRSWGGKARLVAAQENAVAAFDSLGLCRYLLFAAGLEEGSALLAAASGRACRALDLQRIGAETLERERSRPTPFPLALGSAALPERLFIPGDEKTPPSSLPPLERNAIDGEVQRYLRLRLPAPPAPLVADKAGDDALLPSLRYYAAKLVAEGIGKEGRIALIAADDRLLAVGSEELQRLGKAILEQSGGCALCLVEPPWPFADFLLRRATAAEVIVPRDSETRTFLHEIPLLRGPFDPKKIAAALGGRKGVILEGGILCARGALTIEQAYVHASSLWHALSIKYLLDLLVGGFLLPDEEEVFAAFRASALREPDADGLVFRPGPLASPAIIEEEMIRVGAYTVERRLVDSFFGNLSCRLGNDVFISATASSLDALGDAIDPIPFDNRTTLGLIASSELAAHQGIYAASNARTILHGHPRFTVALSILCPDEKECPVSDCWRDCPQVRQLNGVPIVAGEIGAGGLAQRVPPVIAACGQAIVYGHGLFAIGRSDFSEPFHALVATERWCRQEYFRRFDCGKIFG